MKKMFKLLLVTFSLMMALNMTACGIKDSSVAGIKEYGKLVIATSPDFPPFEYMEGDKIVGWDIDVAQYFADELGVKLKIEEMDFDSVVGAPNANKAHIAMAGITNNEERRKTIDFTDVVYYTNQVIIVKADNTDIASAADLAGKKVGAQNGTTGFFLADMDPDWAFIDDEAILGAPSEAVGYNKGIEAVADLKLGRIDAIIIDEKPAENFVANNEGIAIKIVKDNTGTTVTNLSIMKDEYSFAVKKGNTELATELNRLFKKCYESGRLKQIFEKYDMKFDPSEYGWN